MTVGPGGTHGNAPTGMYPSPRDVPNEVPQRARDLLLQAYSSIQAPAGAVVLAAGAIDAMLKAKNLKNGTLYQRIEQAVAQHIITADMGEWAHDVRLDANDQRHADESVSLPSEEDVTRVLDFAEALAEYLFVLPARVKRGRAKPTPPARNAGESP